MSLDETLRLGQLAREAVAFLRFAFGPDVHIGISDVAPILVQPANSGGTFSWDAEGVMGWDNTDSSTTDIYEILRRNDFGWTGEGFPPPAIEDNVMTLGDAVAKSITALVDWTQYKASQALEAVMA